MQTNAAYLIGLTSWSRIFISLDCTIRKLWNKISKVDHTFWLSFEFPREYWLTYRGPGFLAVIWFGSSPTPSPPLPSVSSTGDTQEDWEKIDNLLPGEGGGEGCGRRAESYDRKTVWSSVKHSILSGIKSAPAAPCYPIYAIYAIYACCMPLRRKTKRGSRESVFIGELADRGTGGEEIPNDSKKRVIFFVNIFFESWYCRVESIIRRIYFQLDYDEFVRMMLAIWMRRQTTVEQWHLHIIKDTLKGHDHKIFMNWLLLSPW